MKNQDERYAPNTITWQRGDVVLHYADAKHPKMFMRVIGYTRDGLCKTQYIGADHKRTIYKNDIKNLLDPTKFGLTGIEDAYEFERARLWNFYCPVGTIVILLDAVGTLDETMYKTTSAAWLSNNQAVVRIEGVEGEMWLKWVRRV